MGDRSENQQKYPSDDGQPGGLVESVAAGSPADEAGVSPGDRVQSLDAHILRDIIDYQFQLEPGRQELEIVRKGQRLVLTLEHGTEDPGIIFADALFDQVRTCACNCIFCFVDQLPQGLRPSLYLKDDDFRLSFLHGNFITLNGIDPPGMDRIISQRLSPLYISVHATDTEVRAQLMGVNEKTATRGLDNLRRLGEAGIETHIQVVICPGINDGGVLERTVKELGEGFPSIASVGVVPVSVAEGLAGGNNLPHEADKAAATDTGKKMGKGRRSALRRVSPEDSEAVIEAIEVWQAGYRISRGIGFVYAADEFYLLAGRELPAIESYDGFPQYENGIGIAASFLADVDELWEKLPMQPPEGGSVYLLTGTLAAGVVESACEHLNDTSHSMPLRPLIAENRLLGPHVTVTGLLGGRDIIDAAGAAGLDRRDLLLIPPSCLNNPADRLFLDDISLEEMNEILPCAILLLLLG